MNEKKILEERKERKKKNAEKRKQKEFSDKPKKDSSGLTSEQKTLYKHAKWLYNMIGSSKAAYENIRKRNQKTPEFASKEAKGFYEGQMKAYDSALRFLTNDFKLPIIEEIVKLTL